MAHSAEEGLQLEIHAITRARERYGLELTLLDLRTLAARVRCSDVNIVYRDAEGLICEAHVYDVLTQFVYHIESGKITTFRPVHNLTCYVAPTNETHITDEEWRRVKAAKRDARDKSKQWRKQTYRPSMRAWRDY